MLVSFSKVGLRSGQVQGTHHIGISHLFAQPQQSLLRFSE